MVFMDSCGSTGLTLNVTDYPLFMNSEIIPQSVETGTKVQLKINEKELKWLRFKSSLPKNIKKKSKRLWKKLNKSIGDGGWMMITLLLLAVAVWNVRVSLLLVERVLHKKNSFVVRY